MAEAGYPDGFDLTFYIPVDLDGMPEIIDVGEIIGNMWGEIGINVNIAFIENSVISQKRYNRELNGAIYLWHGRLVLPSLAIGSIWRKSTAPYYEYPFITDWKENYDTIADPAERERLAQELGNFWHYEHLSIPLLWVFGKAAYNPIVVEGYEVIHGNFGPVRYHEYTLPASREA